MSAQAKTRYWLFKSEPDTFSFEDLKKRPKRTEPWDGVRNYQARNFMRDECQVGDPILFYHSSCPEPGVAGLAEVASEPYPDPKQFDPQSDYYDAKATKENPRWVLVNVRWKADLPRPVSLQEIKAEAKLADMKLVQKGQRLSIQPVTKAEFEKIVKMAGA